MHLYFRQREALVFNVGRISHQEQDLRFIKDGVFLFFFFGDDSIYLIKFVVSRSYNPSVFRLYDYSHRVGDSVSHAEKSNFYFSANYYRVRLHNDFFHGGQVREFRLAFSHQENRKFAGIDGRAADARKSQRNASDIVQVSVGDEKRADFILAFFQVSGVGDDIVHSRSRLGGEMHTRVNDDDVIVNFYRGHILADFFQASQGDNADYTF